MDNFQPPNILNQTQIGDRFSASRQTAISDAINRLKDGIYGPQANYPEPQPWMQSVPTRYMTVMGTWDQWLFCVPIEQSPNVDGAALAAGTWASANPTLFVVSKPTVLTDSWYATDNLWIYPGTASGAYGSPPTVAYSASYSLYSQDGNSRVARRAPYMGYSGTAATETQVISPMYFTNANIVVAYQALQVARAPNVGAMIATFNFGGTVAAQVTVSLPTYLLKTTQISYVDLNIDARHWVAQTIS
jgi:hypothetical protein